VQFLVSIIQGLRLYVSRQASGWQHYLLEQVLFALFGWIPTIVGIGIRGIFYRLILRMDGLAAIENGVRLRMSNNIKLSRGVYLDQGVYLHACPQGIEIGSDTLVMDGAIVHVYNFRNLPHSGIKIGRNSLIGEYSVIRGQGGVQIGDRVYTSPFTQILPELTLRDLLDHLEGKIDQRSPENIMEELWKLKQLGMNNIHMYADLFTVNRDQVMGLCKLMIEQNINIRWTCNSRVDYVDEELLTMMGKAGCWLISWGIESGNEQILKHARKGAYPEKAHLSLTQARDVKRLGDCQVISYKV
jgi:acetyltransferase-like isoleucine patch superfamily enzyme